MTRSSVANLRWSIYFLVCDRIWHVLAFYIVSCSIQSQFSDKTPAQKRELLATLRKVGLVL